MVSEGGLVLFWSSISNPTADAQVFQFLNMNLNQITFVYDIYNHMYEKNIIIQTYHKKLLQISAKCNILNKFQGSINFMTNRDGNIDK